MTRAKDHLHLIVPQRFFSHSQRSNGDRHMYASRTQFIPDEILNCFECCAWPATAPASVPGKITGDPVNIGERLRRMWG